MTGFSARPLIPGHWEYLSMDEAMDLVRLYSGSGEDAAGERDYDFRSIRALPVPCLKDSLLIEIEAFVTPAARTGLMNVLFTPMGFALLTGNSNALHRLTPIRLLDTPAQALSFITLFCNAVHGDEGRFQTIHALDELQFRDDAVPSAEIESAILQGLTVSRSDTDDGWAAAGTVLYGDALFRTKFTLPLQGTLEMDDDEPVAEKLPIRRERWHRQFRLPPDDDSAGERP
ncbi:MAG: hypothetical protein KDE55_08250 [Novosphingobium sp.]|nr:hypothetical protein [Novosphingobium sp.]